MFRYVFNISTFQHFNIDDRHGLLNRWLKRESAIERERRAWSATYLLLFEGDWRRISLKIPPCINHLQIEGHRLHSTLFFLFLLPTRVLPIGSAVHIYISMLKTYRNVEQRRMPTIKREIVRKPDKCSRACSCAPPVSLPTSNTPDDFNPLMAPGVSFWNKHTTLMFEYKCPNDDASHG